MYGISIAEIPDGGFFMDVPPLKNPELEPGKKNIVINLAGDMSEVRFAPEKNKISFEEFKQSFAELVTRLDRKYKQQLNFIFVPHIFRDLKVIHDVIDMVPDSIRRRRIAVAPYLVGDKSYRNIFSIYKQADLIVGMRYHTNVCSFGLGQNIIGLYTSHTEIKELHNTLGSNEFVGINEKNFDVALEKMIDMHLKKPATYRSASKKIVKNLEKQAKREYAKLNTWLKTL
jgi:polysaccharide pyruvyl transferase WcaK-like protein